MTCREQHLDRYLEGQGHIMTLQQKRVRPITGSKYRLQPEINYKWQ